MCGTVRLPTGTVTVKYAPKSHRNCATSRDGGRRDRRNVMAYIRLPLGIKVALEYEAHGKIVVNVYHVTTSDPIVTIKLLTIADVFANWWETDMAANFSNEIALTNITALNLNVANGEKFTLPVSPPEPGGQISTSVPNNVAQVVSFNTALTGRSFRGRAYHAGLTSADVDGNDVDTGIMAAMLADYATLEGDLDVIDTQLVVASFESLGAPRAEGIATPINTFSATARVDTQRRRLPAA